MAIVVSVVGIKPEKEKEVKAFLEGIEGIEIYGSSPDKTRILILTDTGDREFEDICKKVAEHEDVYDMLQHSFYFDDDTPALKS